MTLHTLETLQALTGPELNAIVAGILNVSGGCTLADGQIITYPLPNWAGEIGAAFELVKDLKYCFRLDNVGFCEAKWRAMIGWGDDAISVNAEADTAPRCIVIAFVLAREGA